MEEEKLVEENSEVLTSSEVVEEKPAFEANKKASISGRIAGGLIDIGYS